MNPFQNHFYLHAILLAAMLIGLAPDAWGQARSSSHYQVESEVVSSGAGDTSSPSFSSTSSSGLPPPTEQASPEYSATPELSGQLAVSLGFAVGGPANVPEMDSALFLPATALDDGTYLAQELGDASFELVQPNDFASLHPMTGRLTSSAVLESQSLTIKITRGTQEATRTVTLTDNLKDNYGFYAGDGLADAWQVQFFGLGNPSAGADQDPDQDGVSNLVEFLTGSLPLNGQSSFRFQEIVKAGSNLRMVLPKVLPERRYRIQRSVDLSPPWTDLFVLEPNIEESHVLVTVPAVGSAGFYRVTVELR